MASLRGIVGRVRGDRLDAVARDVAEIGEYAKAINHAVLQNAHAVHQLKLEINHSLVELHASIAELGALVEAQRTVLLELNHDVRSGADEALPLFLGYAERLRLDTDTAIGAVQVIERQLAELDRHVAGPTEPA